MLRFVVIFVLCVYSFSSPNIEIVLPKKFSDPEFSVEIQQTYSKITQKLEAQLQLPPPSSVHIIVCNNLQEIRNIAGQHIPDWVLGIALPYRNVVCINGGKLGVLRNTLASVLQHEVCHLYLGEWEKKTQLKLPIWFNEGICQWVSERLHFDYQKELLSDAAWNRLIPFRELQNGFPIEEKSASQAYSQSQNFVVFITNEYTPQVIPKILENYDVLGDFEKAIQKTTERSFDDLENSWRQSVTPKYVWLWRILEIFSIFTIMALIVLIAFWRRKRKDRAILTQWEEEEEDIEDFRY